MQVKYHNTQLYTARPFTNLHFPVSRIYRDTTLERLFSSGHNLLRRITP